MIHNIIVIFSFALIFFSSIVLANTPAFFQALKTESYNSCIVEDKYGFMWIGTVDGLVKYDGCKKIKYNYYNGAPFESNITTSVFVDSENLIWFGIATKGLYSYNSETVKFSHYVPDIKDKDTISSTQFNWTPKNITEDKDGFIWIGTKNGLNSYDKKRQKFNRYTKENSNICDNNILTVYVDREDFIWIGTSDGLCVYDKKNKSFATYKHNDYNLSNSLVDNHVLAVVEDKEGHIWIGTKNGLSRYDKKFNNFINFKNNSSNPNSLRENNIFSLLIDKDNNLWICHPYTFSIGVEKYDITNNQFSLYPIKENNNKLSEGCAIQSCFEDKHGNLWAVDNISTIYQKNSFPIGIFTYRHNPLVDNGLKCDDVTILAEDNGGTLWIGSRLGIYKFDDKTNKIIASDIFKNNKISIAENISSILEDRDGLFWIGTYDGHLYLFDKNKKFVREFKNKFLTGFTMVMIQDSVNPNFYWLGSEIDGFFKFDKRNGFFKQYKNDPNTPNCISNNNVVNIFQDGEGIIWLPTIYGLNRFDPVSEKFTRYIHDKNNDGSISGNIIKDCYIDSNNNFWITTDDGGLNKFDKKQGTFKHFGSDTIPTKATLAILEDDKNRLWLSTLNKGIIVFDILTERVVDIYDVSDGLQGNCFSHFVKTSCGRKNGEIWFSGLDGISKIYPNALLHKDTHKPPIYLTSFSCQGDSGIIKEQSINKIKEINIPWDKNSFEFEFIALNYINASKNKYAYKLEGFEKDWNYIGTNRYGKYTNIPPGKYTLCLKGSNNDGIWNEIGTSIEITIMPPFWITSWFKGLIGVVILCIIGGIFQLRAKVLEKRAIYMRDSAIAKTTAQVAHDIRSPLTLLGVILDHLPELPEDKRIMVRDSMQRINDIANNLLSQYRTPKKRSTDTKINDSLKSELISILLNSLISEKRAQMVARSIGFNLDMAPDAYNCFVQLEAGKFKRMISNLINNSIEALPDFGGAIRIILTKGRDSLVIKIVDNGRGIPEDILPKIKQGGISIGKQGGSGLGISGAIQNIKNWNGIYDIQSKEGEGTSFIISLPIAEVPNWFQNNVSIAIGTYIIILDDDKSIHDVWETKFGVFKNQVTLDHFYNSSTLKEYCEISLNKKQLFLIDYELIGSDETGLNLIEKLNLKDRAILVTSRYEEPEIREKATELSVKIIPKNFAPYIPIFIS